MKSLVSFGMLFAALGAVGVEAQQRRSGSQVVTIVGCVEPETEYRKRVSAGRGGVLGTGIEAQDEFVLTQAREPEAGSTSAFTVYSMTGRLEKEMRKAVGRRIEVLGFLENPDASQDPTDVEKLPRINVNVWRPSNEVCTPAR